MLGKENTNIVLVCFISLKPRLVLKPDAPVSCVWQDVVNAPQPQTTTTEKTLLKHL